MKLSSLSLVLLALAAAGCAAPKTEAPPPVVTGATAPPTVLETGTPPPAPDPALVATAAADLRALGYAAGKPDNGNDPVFQRALTSFEKDQGLATDGVMTPALLERLKAARLLVAKSASATLVPRAGLFVSNDGRASRQPFSFVMPTPKGLVAQIPAKFLEPLRPGVQGVYHLGHSDAKGFTPTISVICRVGRSAALATPFGSVDALAVDCRGDDASSSRAFFSPALGTVVRQETPLGARDLVAIRPVTDNWPSAARTGLDWALTHALEDPAGAPATQWSSTAVASKFEIRGLARLSGQDAGLAGKYAAASCRRFDMTENGSAHYPGIACQDAGGWMVPGSGPLAAPGAAQKIQALNTRSVQR